MGEPYRVCGGRLYTIAQTRRRGYARVNDAPSTE